LILWLANSMGDQAFVSREVQKITNFVEGGDARRAVPVVSFIARQRDLRDLVGANVAGDVRLGFLDTLKLAEGRFDTITLEDRNLPRIAHERLLKPVDDAAAKAVAAAFESTTRVRGEIWDAMLGGGSTVGADMAAFRLSYPFSPAFMDTLVYVSSALQRSRTALKLMRQLLVDHRNDLRLGQVVPLGDLYDVISRGGDQPFTDKLKAEFDAAQKLYETKLRPYLLEQHGFGEDELARARRGVSTGDVDATMAGRVRAFTGDDRLMKTLLLSALAPTVPALRNLTVRRLSALNHGSITSPIPGQETSRVAQKAMRWAARFGEIKVTPEDDPGVRLELVGVDVDSVLASAGHYDTPSERRRLVQELLWEELGVGASDSFVANAELTWRGSRRSVEVLLGVVRDPAELSDDAFRPLDPTAWRLVVDFPFDEGSHGSADDRARVGRLVESGFGDRTVCWLAAQLTAERVADLRSLVIHRAVLSGQRFGSHAQHLGPADRERARVILVNKRDALTSRMRAVLRQAYGLAAKQPEDVDVAFDDHLMSLWPGLHPTLPVGASMVDALRRLAGDMLAQQYPAHPNFDLDRTGQLVRPADVGTVFQYVRQAVETVDGRVEVAKNDRATVRRVANPLRLGEMHEAGFVLGRDWVEHFQRSAAKAGVSGDIKVRDLLRWIDEPEPHGLEDHVAKLVVACFAEQTDRAWVRGGTVLTPAPAPSSVTPDMALRAQRLPDAAEWQLAGQRAAAVLGVKVPELLRGRMVREFVSIVGHEAQTYVTAARDLVADLETHADALGIDPASATGRLATARRAADLLEMLDNPRAAGVDLVSRLARADLGGPADRLARSIKTAERVRRALASTPWDSLGMLSGLADSYQERAQEIVSSLSTAAQADELTTPLHEALASARAAATALVNEAIRKPPSVPPPPPRPPLPHPPPQPWHLGTETSLPVVPPDGQGDQGTRDRGPVRRRWEVRPGELEPALAELRDAVRAFSGDGVVEIIWRPGP
jgi:hypothetical protein